ASTCTTPCPPNKKPKAPSTAPYPPPPAAVVARVRRRSSTAPATPAAAGPGVPVAPRADPARAPVRVLGRRAPRPALPGQARARERRPAVETPLGLRRQGPRRRPWSGSRRRLLGLEPGTRLVGRPRGTPRRPIRPTTRHRQPPNLQAQPLTASAGPGARAARVRRLRAGRSRRGRRARSRSRPRGRTRHRRRRAISSPDRRRAERWHGDTSTLTTTTMGVSGR